MMYVVTSNMFGSRCDEGFTFGVFETETLAIEAIENFVSLNDLYDLHPINTILNKGFECVDDEGCGYQFFIETCYLNCPLV